MVKARWAIAILVVFLFHVGLQFSAFVRAEYIYHTPSQQMWSAIANFLGFPLVWLNIWIPYDALGFDPFIATFFLNSLLWALVLCGLAAMMLRFMQGSSSRS